MMVQTWVLKVSIHCEGCKKKVKKVLQKVEGVRTIDIDSRQNTVTVSGNVNAESLIRRLLKYGKHAELLPEKNRTTANCSTSAADVADVEAKDEEKAASMLETERKQHVNSSVTAETQPEANASDETTTATKPDKESRQNSGDTPLKLENDTATPTPTDGEGRKKEVQIEEIREDEEAVCDSSNIDSRTPVNPFMADGKPVYTMGYSATHPSTSYAYYEALPATASSYVYSAYPRPEYYSSEPYYGSMEPPVSSAGSYDMFNEENPNACNLM